MISVTHFSDFLAFNLDVFGSSGFRVRPAHSGQRLGANLRIYAPIWGEVPKPNY